MNRRETLGAVVGIVAATSGCGAPTVTERQTGEIDIEFRTEATRDYAVRVRLVDADGNLEDEFESGFPPDEEGGPSYYSAGLANGPYTVTVETDAERETVEWSIPDCPRLDLDVTVLGDGRLSVDRTCSTP